MCITHLLVATMRLWNIIYLREFFNIQTHFRPWDFLPIVILCYPFCLRNSIPLYAYFSLLTLFCWWRLGHPYLLPLQQTSNNSFLRIPAQAMDAIPGYFPSHFSVLAFFCSQIKCFIVSFFFFLWGKKERGLFFEMSVNLIKAN